MRKKMLKIVVHAYGPPGCGKSRHLLDIEELLVKQGFSRMFRRGLQKENERIFVKEPPKPSLH